MKVILIVLIVLAVLIAGGFIACLCAADADDLKEWGDDDEQDR